MNKKDCPEASPHGWTLDTLEEFLSTKIKALAEFTGAEARALKEQSAAAMAAASKAIDKAELATERRFEGVNEFRQTLSDQARNFISREEYVANYKALEDKVQAIQSRMDSREGQFSGISGSWGFVIGLIGAVYGIVTTTVLVLRIMH